MRYEIQDFPEKVKKSQQNISIKFSPSALQLELITSKIKSGRPKDLLDIQELQRLRGNSE